MKKILILFLIVFSFQITYSQENYSINGVSYKLKVEIEGELDLLWNIIDGEYRYFVRNKTNEITELKNTRDSNKAYQQEYIKTLEDLTNGMSADNIKLTLYSLRDYMDRYNSSVNPSYNSQSKDNDVKLRLGLYGGITNNPFVSNPKNSKVPLLGAEIEIYEASNLPRHSGFLQGRYTFDTAKFNYSTTEFSLGYRYRFVNKSTFSIYAQVKFATLNMYNFIVTGDNDTTVSNSETSFDVPFIFGIGSDIKVSDNGFITINYGELFAARLDNQGNFSTDITLGYKFTL